MSYVEGMSIFFGAIAVMAASIYIWLCTKWGKKWLKSLD